MAPVFLQNAALSGAMSPRNTTGGAVKQRAGQSYSGNAKQRAGKRSGLRRRADRALIIKKPWLEKIFNREKQWEIRGTATARRGRILLAQPGGLLMGSAVLTDCVLLDNEEFLTHKAKHCIESLAMVKYPKIWAWHLSNV